MTKLEAFLQSELGSAKLVVSMHGLSLHAQIIQHDDNVLVETVAGSLAEAIAELESYLPDLA